MACLERGTYDTRAESSELASNFVMLVWAVSLRGDVELWAEAYTAIRDHRRALRLRARYGKTNHETDH